ncbi:MAG TPA: nucleotidyltransferase domain-containing protein [Acidobacteriota bacterium]
MSADRERVQKRLREALLPREEILEAYLFGSLARGDHQPHSDVDVALYVDTSRVPASAFGYEAELATILMRALSAGRVDIVVLNYASPLLYHRVLRDGVRLLARDLRATTAREGYALSRYLDWLPQQSKFDAALGERIRQGEFGR